MKTRKNPDIGAPIAVTKTYDFVRWLLPKVENFPRAYKFTVGDRLAAQGLDLLSAMVEAAYASRKEDLLQVANRKVNSTRYLLRLAKDMSLMSADSYAFSAESLDEIGRMVGGWLKAQPGRA
jgi:hypothetical protein